MQRLEVSGAVRPIYGSLGVKRLTSVPSVCSLGGVFPFVGGVFVGLAPCGKEEDIQPQPPYSPDLSPCDFFLFPKLKFHLKGRHFGTVDNIQKVVTDQLRALPLEDFQHCYREWEQRLRRCVASQGNYFEGDNVDL